MAIAAAALPRRNAFKFIRHHEPSVKALAETCSTFPIALTASRSEANAGGRVLGMVKFLLE